MKDAMASASLSDNAVDLILKEIADLQDKMDANTDRKLENYVPMPKFNELEATVQSNGRRVTLNEQQLKDTDDKCERSLALSDNLRKQMQRLQSEVDALKKNSSSMAHYPPVEVQVEQVSKGGDKEIVDGGGLDKLQKLI